MSIIVIRDDRLTVKLGQELPDTACSRCDRERDCVSVTVGGETADRIAREHGAGVLTTSWCADCLVGSLGVSLVARLARDTGQVPDTGLRRIK